ncbi:MAG: carboxypeptidase-like regulatory domain-containing protein [Phocaeicola sp.]|uniref:carboxypeptidase-like regulatory domain-containing protein n=1 Tax=Phocaeicola TaxID=909656 RepID=UPI00234F29C6|nr:carboxypeptidase-like regulatory domain-containing protein [Phocaeicola oris]MCE2617170.1 carboxypeptidase-like regulatory domain-containing protein [Phocaeicola oris]
MKAIKFVIVCLLVCCLPQLIYPNPTDDDKFITVKGIVKDRSNKKVLSHASITVVGEEIATVTNKEGEFTIKIPVSDQETNVEISHMGYYNSTFKIEKEKGKNRIFWLVPSSATLGEVIIEGHEPRSLVTQAIEKIGTNYDTQDRILTGFYRETAEKRRHYINISEAVTNIFKSKYKEDSERDKVAIEKGRKLASTKVSDTLAIKLIGGPNIAKNLDLVKNRELLLDVNEMENYEFHMEDMASINGRPQYVVSFLPARDLPYALYIGKLYIDKERLSFTRIDMELDLSDKNKAIQAILRKKPGGLIFKPQEVSIHVDYIDHNGVTYLSYIQDVIRFKCDWKKKLFHTNYTVIAETVITDRKIGQSKDISRKDRFGEYEILSDNVSTFYDENFWGPYNTIQPDEALDKAIKKLKKQHK